MTIDAILSSIDEEIRKLQQARVTLSDLSSLPFRSSVGRPKGAKAAASPKLRKRVLSQEARAKIAAAQRKRWATAKKTKA